MFTGIVEEVGTVLEMEPLTGGLAFRIGARTVLEGVRPGDSISIDGACHTVTSFDREGFRIESVATTLQRTTLGRFEPGRRVNLERAMAVGDRLGGHFVQGHVDAVGGVVSVQRRGEHVLIDFTLPALIADSTILHGSIALNGVSLTVNALPTPESAQVSIIPHTWKATALSDLLPGAAVNLEGDLIGKYVRHLLTRPGVRHEADPTAQHPEPGPGY